MGKLHSWSQTHHAIARELIKNNHSIEMLSTNGLEHFPIDLKPYLKYELNNKYDCQISYTAMHNFRNYMNIVRARNISKPNRFGIWTNEFDVLPKDFAKNHIYVDKILAPSEFSRNTYLKEGIPENKVVTIHHGINKEDFINLGKLPLKTNKTIKLCTSIAQAHSRKGIEESLEAYCKAFTKKDDICYVLKISTKKPEQKFEVDVFKILERIKRKYPNHAEIELISTYIPNIYDLYNSCDAIYLLSKGEGFGYPYLESLAAGKMVIATRYSGHMDFLNDSNSLLVDGKLERAPADVQYWVPSPHASWFKPNLDSAVAQLRHFYNNHESIKQEKEEAMKKTVDEFTWEKQVNKIINLVEL